MDYVNLLDMFPGLSGCGAPQRTLSTGKVTGATVEREHMTMTLDVSFDENLPPVYAAMVERCLEREYSLSRCTMNVKAPEPKTAPAAAPRRERKAGKAILGRVSAVKETPMGELTLESGRVAVTGKIFAMNCRDVKSGAFILNFDMTDGTGSVRVSKFIKDENEKAAARTISTGMTVTCQGTMSFNRFDNDVVLEPYGIASAPEKEPRRDTAEEKRVELHLHTKMSAMDAVTDVGEAVRRAIAWGHPAIAITDHGVCQSFPDAMKAAGDKIKVLYGVEGYYVNDVDDRVALMGTGDGPLSGDFVAFDIETTGLSSRTDALTEIGAVRFHGGMEAGRFQTFVDPGRRIPPEIVNLTGITDEMVAGAPDQETAVRDFLAFAGDLPLVAHNANFDIGFIDEVCRRAGIAFDPTFLDTLTMAQGMLPELRNHKLDMVAGNLGLPDFNHHRASDDACTCGLIFARFALQLAERGVKRLSEIDGAIREDRQKGSARRRPRPQHIILLARTQAGIKNLYKIVTASHLEYLHTNPIMPKSLITRYREGLIVGSACEAGEVFQTLVDGRSRFELRRVARFYDYLEIQPICNNMFMLRGDRPRARDEEELRSFNRRILELGDELGKPTVATGDVHFLDPEDEIFRHVLLVAKDFEDGDKPLPIYFRTTDEMLEEFSYLGSRAKEVVVDNPRKIAELCDTVRPLPPAGVLYPPRIENSEQQLKDLVYGRMRELYGEDPPEIVTGRVEQELHDILSRHYDVIYMSAQKLVQDSLAHGYLVGSRGSVGSSIVAFLSGITEVNSLPPHYRCPKCRHTEFPQDTGCGCGADMPDKVCPVCGTEYVKDGFDIPFETFLGFGGDKVPDIDLNFSGEYQANAHRYTNELFGSDHVFRAGTIGGVAEKTAYGYVKRYMEKTGYHASRAEETRLALGCVGVKRTTGQHPGGLVVIPQDMEICDFCPAQHPADDKDTDIITTHFEYHCMEDNLLKLDELGHDDPTMIRMLEDLTGLDARKIRLDDAETMGIFKSAAPLGLTDDDPIVGRTGTIGIPEFGTGFTRQMLVDTQPENFDTLVRLSGFSHGTDVWLGNAKDLITSGTASVRETVGCRDDIMLYLISRGMEPKLSFKIMEAVRKGKVKKGGFQEGWVETMKAHGVPDWYIDSLAKIAYLFPKAHAVAYVMMAFRIAWFKVHRPLEFYAAYFYRRSQKGGFDAKLMCMGEETVRAAIRNIKENPDATDKDDDLMTTLEACWEFYKRGFTFLPIDLYQSDALKFKVEGAALRPPFVAVSGLGEATAQDLAEHGRGAQFVSVEELLATCPKLSRANALDLRELGALGNMPESSQISLF